MIKYIREILFLPIFNWQLRLPFVDDVRFIFLKLAGVKVVGRSVFYGNMTIRPYGGASKLRIGKSCFINERVRFSCANSKVEVGDKCLIGPNVSFECASHGLMYRVDEGRGLISSDIIVRDRVWIGANVTILGGVEIGCDVVVGSCSLVNKNLESGWVYCGVPAKKLKRILEGNV